MQQSDEMTHGETADPLAGNACQLAWTVEDFKAQIRNHLVRTLGLTLEKATESDWWTAVCYSVRDGVLERGTQAQRVHDHQNVRRVYYLSLEYLMGRLLENSLVSVGLLKTARAALEELGQRESRRRAGWNNLLSAAFAATPAHVDSKPAVTEKAEAPVAPQPAPWAHIEVALAELTSRMKALDERETALIENAHLLEAQQSELLACLDAIRAELNGQANNGPAPHLKISA